MKYILTKLLFKAIKEKLVEEYHSSIFNKLSSSEVIINVASTTIVVPTKILSEFNQMDSYLFLLNHINIHHNLN